MIYTITTRKVSRKDKIHMNIYSSDILISYILYDWHCYIHNGHTYLIVLAIATKSHTYYYYS